MTNNEQLALIRQGAIAWNEWRSRNPELIPDLSSTNLSLANLSLADLKQVNFGQANLKWANLTEANLTDANLSHASLKWANLTDANLSRANFRWADLSQANLSQGNFTETNLGQTNLSQSNLVNADLRNAELCLANLNGADLTGANLSGVDLTGANLSGADFTGADLTGAKLFKAQALGTNFTRAVLTDAQLEDCTIDSETKFDETIPTDVALRFSQQDSGSIGDDIALKEPTNLLERTSVTVDLSFSYSIDWKAFLHSLQDLQLKYDSQTIKIQALEVGDDGALVVRLNIPPDTDQLEFEGQAIAFYETHLQTLESEYSEGLQATDEQIADFRRQSVDLLEVVKFQATKPLIERPEPVQQLSPEPETLPEPVQSPALEKPPEPEPASASGKAPESEKPLVPGNPRVRRAIVDALDAYIAPDPK